LDPITKGPEPIAIKWKGDSYPGEAEAEAAESLNL